MKKITKSQAAALEKLRAMQPFSVTFTRGGNEVIETGLNTTTVHSLRNAGLIKCEMIWLSGIVSPDLTVVS